MWKKSCKKSDGTDDTSGPTTKKAKKKQSALENKVGGRVKTLQKLLSSKSVSSDVVASNETEKASTNN